VYGLLFWDKSTIVSGHFDRMIRVWDRDTAVCRLVLIGHGRHSGGAGVRRFARYKNLLLSGSENVRMWDLNTGECLRVFETEPGYVTCVSHIAVDGGMMAASYHDRTARVWGLESG
jgi:WD40 repeat protein